LAIDPANLTCDNQDDHPVVAFGRWGHRESAWTIDWEPWQLYCQPCLDEQRRWRPTFEYVPLDPARVRGAKSVSLNHDGGTWGWTVHNHVSGAACTDGCHPYAEPPS
jgi:hypothetical protein